MKLYSIETGNFKLDGGAMFGVVPKPLWHKVYPADENNRIPMSMRSLLIVDEDRKILIDNGLGDKQSEKFFSRFDLFGDSTLEKSLVEHGFTTSDITDVFLTHLHFDHCGGSVKYDENGNLVPAFENAKYWVSEAQWNWAVNPNDREKASFLKENILPIQKAGQLELFSSDQELFPDVLVKIFDGHTEGQAIPFIKYKNTEVIFTADVLAFAAHLPLPWMMSYDIRPMQTLKEKEEFLQYVEKNNSVLFFQHDFFHECIRIEKGERAYQIKESFKLHEL